jgi:hypothetical protein
MNEPNSLGATSPRHKLADAEEERKRPVVRVVKFVSSLIVGASAVYVLSMLLLERANPEWFDVHNSYSGVLVVLNVLTILILSIAFFTWIGRKDNPSPTQESPVTEPGPISDFIGKLIALPFLLLWDIVFIVGAILLEVIWIGFLFGSVVGVVLVLIFAPELFVAPVYFLLSFVIHPWPWTERPYT